MQEQELTPNMNYDLSERLVHELSEFAREHAIDRIVLFGSRARGTNTQRSDVDIAVYGEISIRFIGMLRKKQIHF